MISRADELQRLEDFQLHLKGNFSKADLISNSEPMSEETKNKAVQQIQVFPVKQIKSEKEQFCRHFEHRRSYSAEGKGNGIEHRWVERRIFTSMDAFPGISATSRIVNVKTIHLQPVILNLRSSDYFLIFGTEPCTLCFQPLIFTRFWKNLKT